MTKKRKVQDVVFYGRNFAKRVRFHDDLIEDKLDLEFYGDPEKFAQKLLDFSKDHIECNLDHDSSEYYDSTICTHYVTGLRPATEDELKQRETYFAKLENDEKIAEAKRIEQARALLRKIGEL